MMPQIDMHAIYFRTGVDLEGDVLDDFLRDWCYACAR